MIDYLSLKDEYSTTVVFPKKEQVNEIELQTTKTSQALKTLSISAPLLLTPSTAFAGAFEDIHRTVMTIFDGGVVLIIIFAGASWALGHRSKAIELLIGVCCGYLLARHAIDIRDYLKSIG